MPKYETVSGTFEVSQADVERLLQKFPSAKLIDTSRAKPKQEDISWFDQTWFGRGMAAASTTGEATDLMSQNFSNIDMESIQDFIRAKEQEATTYVESESMKKFQEQYIKEGKTWSAFFRGVRNQPGLLPELLVQSIGTQVGTLFDSPGASLGAVATGAATGAFGGVAGALAGAMGGLASSMEAALTFGELIEKELQAEGKEFTDENIKALLEGPKGNSIRNKSIGRGLTIGGIEALTGGLAGKAAKAVRTAAIAKGASKTTGTLKASGVAVGIEAAGGGIGEVAGRVVAGQEMDAAEIGFEAITGTVTAPLNVSAALLTAKKPTYRLNGQSITYEQMKNFVDTADDMDVAKADIQMQNDFTGVGKKAKAKQEAAIEGIKLSGDVETIAEVSKAQNENRIAATIELAKQGKQIANVKDSFAVENNEEAIKAYKEIQDQYGKDVIPDQDVTNADGFFVPTPDGNVIIINKDIAAKTGQINVGGHELLHAVIQKHYKSLTPEARVKFINNFKSTISKDSLAYVQKIIDARNKDRVDSKTGETVKGENIQPDSDEYLTIYSDGIVKGEITYNESIFTKFKNFLQDIFRKFGYKKEFGSGLDTYNFMRDYNKNITEFNKISQRAFDVAGSEAVTGKASLSRRSLIEDINKLQQGATTKAEFQKSNIFNNVFKAIQPGGAINNYIRSLQMSPQKTQETIDSVTDRLINFDPAAKRKDGTVIGPEGLGEFIMANVGFAKLDAAKTLAKKSEKTKTETSIDTKEAREIEDETVTPKETKRELKKTVIAKKLGITKEVAKAINKIVPNLDINKLNFKTLKNEIPEITGKLFGIATKKIEDLSNLTKSELQSAQMFINKNADLLIAMLPEGSTISGTSTGVPNTLLKAFYTKTNRAKAAKTGSKAGLAVQVKNSNITKKQFLEVFGIIDGKPTRDDRNTSARVLALANLTGKMITNQAVRQELGQTNDKVTKAVNNIKEGKSDIMFSKSGGNKVLEKSGLKPVSNKNVNDRVIFKTFIEEYLPLFVPIPRQKNGKFRLPSDTYGPNSKIAPGYYITRFERVISAVRAGNVQLANKIYTKKQINQINKAYSVVKFDESQKEINTRREGAELFIKGLNKAVNSEKGNKQNLRPIQMLLSSTPNGTYHIIRMIAPGLGTTNVGKRTKREHVLVANNAADITIESLAKDNVNLVMPWLLDNYYQINVNEQQDALIDDAYENSKEQMPPEFYENLNKAIDAKDMSLASDPLIRYTMANVNLSEIDWHNGGTALSYVDKKYGFDGTLSYGNNSETSVKLVNDILTDFFAKKTTKKEAKKAIENVSKIKFSKTIDSNKILNNAIKLSRTVRPNKGITILDFDDTLAITKSLVKYTTPEGKTGTLNAEEYASTYEDLLGKGYVFDFSDFNKVVRGKLAPLFQKALKLQGKFGPENMFVLTARPPQAQKAIFDFLKANGLNIPLKNITGLGNSTAEAKALWIANKVGEGYNDFYFADDALQNVQAVKNMLEQFDVKSKVQQAKVKFSKTISDDFNDILEDVTGIESFKRFERTKARKRGASKGKFRFFIPPSHEDFVGLLYNFMGKGRKGDAHRAFLEKALVRPLLRAHREIDTAKQAVANDYKALNKQMSEVRDMLSKNTPDGDFTYQDAIRVYLWNKHGYKIPGLSPIDQKKLVDLVEANSSLKSYAETLNVISKQETYVDPGPNWETGNIRIDLVDATGRVGRASYFAEFQENADMIFSEENLNKIEAGYGAPLREALEDMLYRIKTGINRPKGSSAKPNIFMNWLNASVSGVMFFNTRSSLLQQMSNVNYLNFADNNILAAGLAFANQPQYWKDFAMIFNSDMLKQRRGGLQTDINGAELAEAIKKARPGNMFDQVAIIIGKALKLGFLPTQIGDNIAIATGGAAFYRNRVNKYIKEGFPVDQAEKKAFNDFQEITQSTQQSAKPYMTSAQQAMWIGKFVLNFLNTPSQYNRIIKKAGSDLINRRITPPNTTQMQSDMSNMSRILYYGAAQNLIFYSLQTALFAVMFGSEDEDEDKRIEQYLKKKERVINGTIDTILRGSGIYGVAVSTLKNMAIKFMEQREAGYNKDESAVIMELLNFSPVVGIKARRIVNAEKTLNYNKKVIEEMETFDIDNPQWSAVTNYTQAITTAPTNKIYQKTINLRNAADRDYTALQRLMFLSGYTTWSLGLGDTKKMKEIKENIKNKKQEKKEKSFKRTPKRSQSVKRTVVKRTPKR